MDHAVSQLGGNFTTIGHKIWKEISIDVNLRLSGRMAPPLLRGCFPTDEFKLLK